MFRNESLEVQLKGGRETIDWEIYKIKCKLITIKQEQNNNLIKKKKNYTSWGQTNYWGNPNSFKRNILSFGEYGMWKRKAPQSKWSCMDRPNVQNLLVQMDGGSFDRLCYDNLGRTNGRRSNGPPMLRHFGPSKWMTVQWTTYVTSIWTVQNGQRSNGPSMLRQFRPSKWTTVHWTIVHLDGPFGRSIGPPILR